MQDRTAAWHDLPANEREFPWLFGGWSPFTFGNGLQQKPRKINPPLKPATSHLSPDQKAKVWQAAYQNCLSRKEQERQRSIEEHERKDSAHFKVGCIVGGAVGAVEGGIEFGPLGAILGFHAGCALGASETMFAKTLVGDIPEMRNLRDANRSREIAEKDCKKEADGVVSRL